MVSEKDQVDVLVKMYQEYHTNARHHEAQRSLVIQYLLLTGGVIGTLTSHGGVTRDDALLSAFLVVLGVFGAVFSASHYERYHRHKTRAGKFFEEIDEIIYPETGNLSKLKNAADAERKLKIVSVHWLWSGFPLLISFLGAILLWTALK